MKNLRHLNYLIVLFLSLTTLTFTACDNDDDEPKSNTELLTEETWITTAFTITPGRIVNGAVITDLFAQADPCNRDDIFSFKADRSYTIEEGATKCNSQDPQVYEVGTWTFNSDETILTTTDQDGITIVFTIKELSEDQLVIEDTEIDQGVTYTLTGTYRHP